MTRFCGDVGYRYPAEEDQDQTGIFVSPIVVRQYRGDFVRDSRNLEIAEKVNHDISVTNTLSIVADQYALSNFMYISFVVVSGVAWSVQSVEVQRPRLTLRFGGVYNGPTS